MYCSHQVSYGARDEVRRARSMYDNDLFKKKSNKRHVKSTDIVDRTVGKRQQLLVTKN